MRMRRCGGPVIVTLILAALLAACGRVPAVSADDAARIESAARLLLENEPVNTGRNTWPEAIRRLKPHSLRATSDGLYIVTSRWFVEEAGLFVPRHPESFSPVAGGDPVYRRLHGAVYSYRIRG
jgi:hypothetical protein